MWKEYSISYIKNNKVTSISLMVAALISAMFLSLITGIFYNLWVDNMNQIITKEGNWQAKITGEINEEAMERIRNFSNVKEAAAMPSENGVEVSVYFYKMGSIYKDMPKIAELTGMDVSAIQYHDMLLSQYFIFAPDDEQPPLLLAFYVFVMALACISFILIIRNAFWVSMQSRLHQLGILQSIGATPRQIKVFLLQEALGLCLLPILAGILAGTGLCVGVIRLANEIGGQYRGEDVEFSYHVGLFLIPLAASVFTVLCSAWLPVRKISKMSPLQVIKGEEEERIRKVKHFPILSHLFGIEGELAGKSLYVRRKALRTASFSLTLSFFSFSIFLCFIFLSGLSVKYTYFERYKDAWDIMATINGQDVGEIELSDVESCTIYQKALVYTWLTEDRLSDELRELGGIRLVAGSSTAEADGQYRVKVPVVILDDNSFESYCKRVGIKDGVWEGGTITINRIWDSIHSNFRYREFIPFIKEREGLSLTLFQAEDENDRVEIPILGYTDELPVLREEYDDYALVQIMSADTWKNQFANMSIEPNETYINVRTVTEDSIQSVQAEVEEVLTGYDYEIENRVEEKLYDEEMQEGFILMMGGLCSLLAVIGLANVFANTLGYIYQRKREFARYLSIGLTPRGIGKMLCMEALIIGGKPILITAPLTVLFVIFAAKASYVNIGEFLETMPVGLLVISAGMILGCVGLAYYIGGRKIFRSGIMETLKDDSLS